MNLIPLPENDIWTPPILQVIKKRASGPWCIPVTVKGTHTGAIQRIKRAGIAVIYRDINPTPENTRLAEAAGADIIVATGFDEGRTLPGTVLGTFSIVPLIADAVDRIPVMAAGGITDNRTARAAQELGAEGILPVRFYRDGRKQSAGLSQKLLPPMALIYGFPHAAAFLSLAAGQAGRNTGVDG